jgi:hypothetical protein
MTYVGLPLVLDQVSNGFPSGFAPAKVTSPGCGTPAVPLTYFASATLDATAPTGLPTAPPGSSYAYYTITGQNAVLTSGGCSITALDSYVPLSGPLNPAVSIGVEISTVTGVFQ